MDAFVGIKFHCPFIDLQVQNTFLEGIRDFFLYHFFSDNVAFAHIYYYSHLCKRLTFHWTEWYLSCLASCCNFDPNLFTPHAPLLYLPDSNTPYQTNIKLHGNDVYPTATDVFHWINFSPFQLLCYFFSCLFSRANHTANTLSVFTAAPDVPTLCVINE